MSKTSSSEARLASRRLRGGWERFGRNAGAFRYWFLIPTVLFVAGCARKSGETARALQILRIGNGSDPQDLDPQAIAGIPELKIVTALFDSLVEEDPRDLHPIPGLASSWDISGDGLTYTFHLRPNARWSNGDPLTADDFIQSYKRLLTPAFASQFANLVYDYVIGAQEYFENKTSDFSQVGFKAIDPQTLEVRLKIPTPQLLYIIANNYTWDPVPVKEIAKYGPLDQQRTPWTRTGRLVGSGPFMLKEWVPNQKVVLVRNPYYWDAASVKLDQLEFYPTEDVATEERMFRTGQLDVTNTLPNNKVDTYRREYPEALRLDPWLGTYYFYLNVAVPALSDKRVRRALALAIDREAIVKDILRGDQTPALAFTHPNTNGYTPRAQLTGGAVEAAKLLAEAGYPGGRGFPNLEILYNTSENHRAICEAVQEMWKKNLGIEVHLVNQEWKVYLDMTRTKSFSIARAGWIAPYLDPMALLEIWVGNNGNNHTNWHSAEYDRLANAALHAQGEEARFENYQKMDAILVDELPIIPIYFYTSTHALNPKVKGYYPTLLDQHPYKAIWNE